MDHLKDSENFRCETPSDYFQGVRSHRLCQVDNVLVFRRKRRSELSRRAFDTRPHYRYVMVFVYETAGNISVDGNLFPLRPEQAFLVTPYQFHYYVDLEKENLNWLFLTFESDTPTAFVDMANHPIHMDQEAYRLLSATLREYESARTTSSSIARNRMTLKLELLIIQLQFLAGEQDPPHREYLLKSGENHQLLNRIHRVMEAEIRNGIDIPVLAERLFLSPSHLRSKFKRITGVSLGKYLVHYKMNQAIRWILDSENSLSTVSDWVGYESQAAFCRSFKSVFGMSPSQYRKQYRSDSSRPVKNGSI